MNFYSVALCKRRRIEGEHSFFFALKNTFLEYLQTILQINSTFAPQHLPLGALYCSIFCLILQRCFRIVFWEQLKMKYIGSVQLYPHLRNRQFLDNKDKQYRRSPVLYIRFFRMHMILRGEDVVYLLSGVWRYLKVDKQSVPTHPFCKIAIPGIGAPIY